ncbi:MAG: alternative ribosome rescue aminoacyl-tRNA hydrolase ArfB [Salibacteraceae bacterium]
MHSPFTLKLQAQQWEALLKEVQFRTSRSGGPGGQGVNKLETRVELLWSVAESECLNLVQKHHLLEKTDRRMDQEGMVRLAVSESRSQLSNKEIALKRLREWLEIRLRKPTPRRATRPGKAARERRMQAKKKKSERKHTRKRIDPRRDL